MELKTIDARGVPCPGPVVMAKKEIDGGADDFQILVDNEIAVENLKRLADSQGFRLAVAPEGEGCLALLFERREGSAAPRPAVPAAPAAQAMPQSEPGDWVLFVPRETVGDGDPALGRTLMEMAFYTLAQGENPPARILFMNGGVRLPCRNRQIIDHLSQLEQLGCQILVCGTCLDFYGLGNELAVGTVSNMYEILSALQTAPRAVTL